MEKVEFTFKQLERSLSRIKDMGFHFSTMSKYQLASEKKSAYLRVDVDYDPSRTIQISQILSRLDIHATFFFRVVSPNYNASSIACLELYQSLLKCGHEIGLHHDSIVTADILKISPLKAFLLQKHVLEASIGREILGSASHGSRYPRNNQDIFSMHSLEELGLKYQAYDEHPGGLFFESRYVSDSEWTHWKSYSKGKLVEQDFRSPECHAEETNLIYILIHPDTYSDRHSFESFSSAS